MMWLTFCVSAAMVEIDKEKEQQRVERLTTGMFPSKDKAPTAASRMQELAEGIAELESEQQEEEVGEAAVEEDTEKVIIGNKPKTRRQLRDQRKRMFEDQKKARAKESKMRETEVTRIKSIRKELMSEEEKARKKEEEKAAKKVCGTCGATNFKTRKQFWDHTRSHKKFTCDLCMKTMSVYRRPTHMKICPGQPAVKNHVCDECEYATEDRSNLQKHILRVHQSDDSHKVHKCTHESCNYATDEPGHLKHHEKTHLKLRCNHENCFYETKNERYLRNHKAQVHDGGFICLWCGEVKACKRNLGKYVYKSSIKLIYKIYLCLSRLHKDAMPIFE